MYTLHTHTHTHTHVAVNIAPANCSNGDIRLVGGQRSSEGRIEMCQNRAWGTITDDGWGVVDARVACRELGFSTIGLSTTITCLCVTKWSCVEVLLYCPWCSANVQYIHVHVHA